MAEFSLPGDESTQLFIFEKFGTLNTKANRPMIKDEEFAWNENWMPLGDGNLRTLPGEGTSLYTAPAGRAIVYYYPFNLGPVSYVAVFLDNGTAVQVRVSDSSVTTIGSTTGQFYVGGGTLPAAAQWESKYLLIVATTGTSAYWIWDGTNLSGAGTLSPDITITNGGSGYTSAPTVTAVGGSGSGATFVATVKNGSVTSVQVTNPGTGYLIDDNVQLAFSGGGSDTSALATASIVNTGGVASVTVTDGGGGYTSSSGISFSGGGGTGAQGVISGAVDGTITEVSVTNPGTGYTSAPTVFSNFGTGFVGVVDIRRGQVGTITVTNGGTGYTSNPQVLISAPDADSVPVVQAQAIATVSAGVVTGITVTIAGLGYINPPTVTLIGGNNAATASVGLMPFGVAGTTIETYQGSVWIANGTDVVFSAPGETSTFATSAGGGSYQATDNFLRERIVCFKQTNGFLYQFGDSSINVISNVQTSGTPATTTFNNSNVDPQVGTPWRDTVVAFGRALVFANSSGVYALYGGAAEKVSGPLDKLFANATFNGVGGSGITPVAAVSTIFGIRVYMLLFTTFDPYAKVKRTIFTMWDGQKWWVASQIAPMALLNTQEIDSNLSAYGSDGFNIYPLFQTPNTNLNKVFQSKLRGDPSPIITKQVNKVYILAETNEGDTDYVNVSIDTEIAQGQLIESALQSILTFTGTSLITFVGSSAITWTVSGLALANYSVGDYGRYIGMTFQTDAADLTLLQLSILYRDYAPNA